MIPGHGESVSALLLVNAMLYTGSADAKARCFVTEFGDLTKTYGSHRDTVNSLRFSDGIREWNWTSNWLGPWVERDADPRVICPWFSRASD